jgi:hypothetical protein
MRRTSRADGFFKLRQVLRHELQHQQRHLGLQRALARRLHEPRQQLGVRPGP